MKTFIVKSESKPPPEVFVVIPRAHAATTTDRALARLASEEEARQKWRWRQGEQHEVLMHYMDQNSRLPGQRRENDNDVEVGHLL